MKGKSLAAPTIAAVTISTTVKCLVLVRDDEKASLTLQGIQSRRHGRIPRKTAVVLLPSSIQSPFTLA